MKSFFQSIFDIGITNNISKMKEKKIRMLNVACVFSILFSFFLITKFFLLDINPIEISLFHFFIILGQIFIIYLQKIRRFFLARISFLALLFIEVFSIANYFKPSILVEYFYILIPLFTIYFINTKKIQYVSLVVSILFFYVPNQYLNHYPESMFGYGSFLGVFLAPFIMIKYLMTMNTKNEQSLEIQKNAAIKDNDIIKEQRKELEELNKFQSKFFINIAHEIRTPLTLILGRSDELMEYDVTKYNKKISNIVYGIHKQAKDIQTIVDDILDLAKMSTNQFQLNLKEISLSNFLNSIYASFEPFFVQNNVQFIYESTIDCTIIADTVYLERALNNLIFNAIKYTPEGGTVSLTFDKEDENSVVIILKDSGVGIPKEDLQKIFKLFYQSDNDTNKSRGSGIGLSFTKETIEKHNGSIEVISEEGLGSEFRVILPVTSFYSSINVNDKTEIVDVKKEKKVPISFVTSSMKRLLIVDDHKNMRSYIVGLLKRYTCLEASDGMEALSLLKSNSIDMVITDYMMPKMDGYELIKRIKEEKIDVPILMLTARVDVEGKLNVLRLGLDDYITKPFNKEELRIRIMNILNNNESKNNFIEKENIPGTDTGSKKFIDTLQQFIIDQCKNTKFGIEEIVEEFAISKSSLYRKIKMATGLSPNEFINEVKLQHAQNILSNTHEITLKELSYLVGFNQPQYFSKLYEKRFGKKPFPLGREVSMF